MKKNFSLILPTHYHPRLVRRLFDSIFVNTTHLDQLEIVLYLDREDIQSHNLSHPAFSLVKVVGEPDTMGNMIRAGYAEAQGQYIMLLNDDMIFRTNNWDGIVLESFSRFSDDIALVYGNDLYYGHLMCTFPILTRTVCELISQICPAEYQSYCIDAHIFDIFNRLAQLGHKRRMYLKHVVFEHMFYELIASTNCCSLASENHQNDQSCYFSLAQHRQNIAVKMAEVIEANLSKSRETKDKHYVEKV